MMGSGMVWVIFVGLISPQVEGSFKDHLPRRGKKRPGKLEELKRKIPLEDKFERRERLQKEKTRRETELNRKRNEERMPPEAYSSGKLVARKQPETGKVVARVSENRKSIRQRLHKALINLDRKRELQVNLIAQKQSVLHYATTPFRGRKCEHIIYGDNDTHTETLRAQYEKWEPEIPEKFIKKTENSYKQLRRMMGALAAMDQKINRLTIKYHLLGPESHRKHKVNGTVYFEFLPRNPDNKGVTKKMYSIAGHRIEEKIAIPKWKARKLEKENPHLEKVIDSRNRYDRVQSHLFEGKTGYMAPRHGDRGFTEYFDVKVD
ncbi:hypothetical protein AAMO2058_000794800 [Amorphochlora amoebiformis]|mmetsp:Transcript_6103/g.9387  ORF Transcript_6103/g.9387 Transcript_6103/m.9387 type:complete len:320 (-) Transcript_6103:142-1101(-)